MNQLSISVAIFTFLIWFLIAIGVLETNHSAIDWGVFFIVFNIVFSIAIED